MSAASIMQLGAMKTWSAMRRGVYLYVGCVEWEEWEEEEEEEEWEEEERREGGRRVQEGEM